MKRALAILIGCALIAPAGASSYQPVTVITKDDIRKARLRRREEQAICRKARKAGGQIEKVQPFRKFSPDRWYDLTYLLERGEEGCPRDLDLAIAVAETLVTDQSLLLAPSEHMERLWELRLQRGQPADLVRAGELHRYLWVRSSYRLTAPPDWTAEERRAFVARDDVWAEISKAASGPTRPFDLRVEALLDPLSLRFDPKTGVNLLERQPSVEGPMKAAKILLDGKLVAVDRPRAEALLWRIAGAVDEATALLIDLHQAELASADPAVRRPLVQRLMPFVVAPDYAKSAALRARFVPFLIPDLADPDPKVQADAARQLAILGRQGTKDAVAPLLAWVEPRLASKDKAVADDAHGILRSLTMDGVGSAQPVMDREYARIGGLVEAGDWTPDPARPVPIERVILPNDYPTRALREERSGVVRATAVFGPDGRVFVVEIDGTSGSPDLDQAVQAILQRRMRRSWPEWPGRYVRVRLPPIQFRINECDGEFSAPAMPGAVTINASLYCQQPATSVIY
ncbi:MAG: energy transducer TonB [Novosphingobium sp.]